MSSTAFILCVDDEPVNLTIMEELLQDRFDLGMANSGESCLQKIAEQVPDLILLDVNMPDLNGLEICRRLRADTQTSEVPIIFISALASNEELMAGYEAGGDDYITKPFSEDILQKKIDVVLNSQRRKLELQQISDRAVEALRDTQSTSDQLGKVIRFMQRSHVANNLEELARNVFDCLRDLELDGSLLLVDEPENQIWFSDDIARPMESQILESLRGQDRVVQFGTRLALSTDHATLLVRNLPPEGEADDPMRANLSVLVEGLQARLNGLQSRQLLEQQRELLAETLDATRQSLEQVEASIQKHNVRATEIVAALDAALRQAITALGLSAEQAAELSRIAESGVAEIESMAAEDLELGALFEDIISGLSQALDD